MDPPEPMALRLSSNLMVGVSRVYRQQCVFYLNDVNHVFNRLKRALYAMDSETLLPNAKVKLDAITMAPPERDVHLLMADGPPVVMEGVESSQLIEFGWADPSSMLHQDDNSSMVSKTFLSMATTPRAAGSTLLLAEHAFHGGAGSTLGHQADGTSAVGSSSAAGHHSLLPLRGGGGVGGGAGGELDFDFLVGGDDHWAGTSFLQESRRSEAELAGGDGSTSWWSSSSIAEQGGAGQSLVQGGGAAGSNASTSSASANASSAAMMVGDAEHPLHGLPSPREGEGGVAIVQAAKRKKQRLDIICDPVTTLRLDQLRCMEWKELEIQLGGVGQDLTRAPEQQMRQQVYHMMNQPLSNLPSPRRWKYSLFQMPDKLKKKGSKKRKLEGEEQDDSFGSVGEGLQAPGSLFQTPMETEVARAAEPESAGSQISAPWKSWFQNRRDSIAAGSEEGSRSLLLPHNEDFGLLPMADMSSSEVMSRMSNANRLSDTFGLDLPQQQQQQQGDEGDRRTSDIFHTGFPDVFGSGLGVGGLQSGSGAIGGGGGIDTPFMEMLERDLERDTLDFFGYAREKMVRVTDQTLHFQDLFDGESPPGREVAANAFYHVLVLCNRGKMTPYQRRPFHDIALRLNMAAAA